MHFFLWVHKFTPIIGFDGDMWWVSLSVDRHAHNGEILEPTNEHELRQAFKLEYIFMGLFLWDYFYGTAFKNYFST